MIFARTVLPLPLALRPQLEVREAVGFDAVDKHAAKKIGEAKDQLWLNNVSPNSHNSDY